MIRTILDIKNNTSAFSALIIADLKVNVSSTRLGYLWWIIDPLVLMGVYYFVIGVIFQRGGENYHLFILTGIVLFQFFSRSVTGSMSAILSNKALIKQVNLPLVLYVVAPVAVRGFFAVIGIILALLMSFNHIGIHTIFVILLVILMAIFSLSISLILSALNVFVRDTSKLVTYFIRVLFFLSPILYPASKVYQAEGISDAFKTIYAMNPLNIIIESARRIVLEGAMIDLFQIAVLSVLLLLGLQFSLVFFRANALQILKAL